MQATESRLFDGRRDFHDNVLEMLARTRLTVALADRDFSDWPLETPAAFDALARILMQRDGRLRVIVYQPDWLERHGARFALLRRRFAAGIECRTPPPSLAPADGLLLGDRHHLLRRASSAAWRGRAIYAAGVREDVEPWRIRFESLWEESIPCLTATSLGL